MNLIIYLAMTIDFFRSGYRLNGVAEGVIDIIIGVFSICMICVLSIKYKTNILNWKINNLEKILKDFNILFNN